MSDKFLMELCDGWALGYDRLQWIVLRAKIRRDEHYWQGVSFIGSNKRTLRRVLRETGIQADPVFAEYLDVIPEKFVEWLQVHEVEQDEEAA